MYKRLIVLLIVMIVSIAMFYGNAQAQTQVTLYNCTQVDAGDGTFNLVCYDAPLVAPTEVPSETPTVQPTNTPVATETPVPTATPTMVMPMEELMWHAPMAHMVHGSMTTVHEHGDAPPQWVVDYNGGQPSFEHVGGTPNENGHDGVSWWKHTAFKGWEGRFGTTDWYGIFHLDFNPSGHPSRFHSYQLWLRDSTGAISHVSGWLDFASGQATFPAVVITCGNDSTVRPIMKVNANNCPAGSITFENWYARSGFGYFDFGFNINPNYRANVDTTVPNIPSSWSAIGGVRNVTRRLEFAYYDNSPTGEFWTTQFWERVSGPTDPLCGTVLPVGTKTYTRTCLKQFIAPSLPVISFNTIPAPNRNSIQRTFPSNGVQLPN